MSEAIMKLCYLNSPYWSHARTARAYKRCLESIVEVLRQPESADLVVLHDEPHRFHEYYTRYDCLRTKYVIAYSVWEASRLPVSFLAGLDLVQEVWTCSDYSKKAFAASCNNLHVIPHEVEPIGSRHKDDEVELLRKIKYDARNKYLITIANVWNRRKNVDTLVRLFKDLSVDFPKARLIIKIGWREAIPESYYSPQITAINDVLSAGQMECLYSIASAYVSPHHSEGWGLCISDALMRAVPVIATAYSGNLTFMNNDNAFAIPAIERPIKESEEYHLFTRDMCWGEPSSRQLELAICQVLDDTHTDLIAGKTSNGARDMKQFSALAIENQLKARIASLHL
jgi:glycosyltransferase involved in cell wall biosynthesis